MLLLLYLMHANIWCCVYDICKKLKQKLSFEVISQYLNTNFSEHYENELVAI